MMLRKVFSILLAMALLMGLTACGGGNVTSEPADSSISISDVGGADVTTTTGSLVDNGEQSTTSDSGKNEDVTSVDKTTTGGKGTTTTEKGKSTSKTSTTTSATTSGTKTTSPDVNGNYVTVNGSSKNLKTWVYQLADSGIYVREARFDSGKGGEAVTVIHMTDIHFTGINDKDRQENNAALMWTYNKRKNTFPTSVENTLRCMEYASQFDQTVITGDNIDYLSWGTLELLQKNVWDKDPKALVSLGNHDTTRTMSFPDQIADNSTLESRYQMVQSVWKHDVYYTSKVVKNKVMVIQMDDGTNKFWPEQLPKLQADIATAKKNGYVVLLFVHIPLNTKTAGRIQSFHPNTSSMSFTSSGTVYSQSDATKQIYELITNNADVVKGVFCGHEHFNYYSEIKAKTSTGTDAVIPQYVVAPVHTGMGYVMKITVK